MNILFIINPNLNFFSILNTNILGGGIFYSDRLKPIAYFPILILFMLLVPNFSKSQSADTLVCDNGGFEDGLTYFTGQYTDSYRMGGNICTPLYFDSSIIWNSLAIPAFRQFEIVNNGIDTLTGIDKVKFGYKSLLLNNRYGHIIHPCGGQYGVNKILKRFKVTPESRDFTVWYAVVLENPDRHLNQQPWFSISCDRDPANNLCFDASQIECYNIFQDSICTFDTIKLVNWACHTFKIPLNMLDSIATLEITAADCGGGGHFAYAYIDGICELCDGSAFGSGTLYQHPLNEEGLGIDFDPCGDDSLTVCGSYTLPSICGAWKLDSILPIDFNFYSLSIDTSNNKYCFKVALADFTYDSCTEIYLKLFFSSNTQNLDPVYSNTIEICPISFEYELTVVTGSCQNNNTTSLMSDDYYYVQVDLDHFVEGDSFLIERVLDDPYPNETGHYDLLIDTASGLYNLGPFFIQEGNWKLIFSHEDCRDTFNIIAPNYCSGCLKFRGTTISNISCNNNSTYTIADDTWSFDIFITGLSGSFYVGSQGPFNYNDTNTIYVTGPISNLCSTFTLTDGIGCNGIITICPPKPCSDNENCELEAYIFNIECFEDEYTIELFVAETDTNYPCYISQDDDGTPSSGNQNDQQGSLVPGINTIGNFNDDIYLTVFQCNSDECDCELECFKTIYIHYPDCDNLEFRRNTKSNYFNKELNIIPNPVNSSQFSLNSTLKITNFSVFDLSGRQIYATIFEGKEFQFTSEIPPGIYFIRYINSKEKYDYIKLLKQ
ncbi:MAG: T9SS type A sorting domain-containing protein [Saprospiraceae bacterium]|nr:T9SS type A sorting domain-containing protein [Saprospiraceae bacterium]